MANRDVMIDLETFGTRPDAVIAQIAAIDFDIDAPGLYAQRSFNRYVRIDSPGQGRVDNDTLAWWLQQQSDARSAIAKGITAKGQVLCTSLEVALRDFTFYMQGGQYDRVWSHGASFDQPILDSAYARVNGDAPPWGYRESRDTRTLFWLATENGRPPVVPGWVHGTEHDALDDAMFQARQVQVAYQSLTNKA